MTVALPDTTVYDFEGVQRNFEALLSQLVPSGAMMPFGGTTAPAGWVLCDGSTYDGTAPAYQGLYGALGVTWGGTGTSFKVPDLRGRAPIGAGTGAGLTARAVAATGGEEAHQLVTAELAAHNHAIQGSTGAGGTGFSVNNLVPPNNGTGLGSNGVTNNTGSGTAHNNMQPFVAVNYIVKL